MSDLKIEMPLVPIPHEIYFDDWDDDDDDELLHLIKTLRKDGTKCEEKIIWCPCKRGSFVHKKSA